MKAVLWIILFGFLLKVALAIECYACADCKVPFDDDADGVTKKECENTSCMKLTITHADKFSIVSRGCGTGGVQEERCVPESVSDTYSETCYCKGKTCNGSTALKFDLAFGMTVVFMHMYNACGSFL